MTYVKGEPKTNTLLDCKSENGQKSLYLELLPMNGAPLLWKEAGPVCRQAHLVISLAPLALV